VVATGAVGEPDAPSATSAATRYPRLMLGTCCLPWNGDGTLAEDVFRPSMPHFEPIVRLAKDHDALACLFAVHILLDLDAVAIKVFDVDGNAGAAGTPPADQFGAQAHLTRPQIGE